MYRMSAGLELLIDIFLSYSCELSYYSLHLSVLNATKCLSCICLKFEVKLFCRYFAASVGDGGV